MVLYRSTMIGCGMADIIIIIKGVVWCKLRNGMRGVWVLSARSLEGKTMGSRVSLTRDGIWGAIDRIFRAFS